MFKSREEDMESNRTHSFGCTLGVPLPESVRGPLKIFRMLDGAGGRYEAGPDTMVTVAVFLVTSQWALIIAAVGTSFGNTFVRHSFVGSNTPPPPTQEKEREERMKRPWLVNT